MGPRPALLAGLLLLALPSALAVGTVQPFDILVDGQPAHGIVGIPAGAPSTLVVLCHGFGGSAASFGGWYQALADQGVLAVGMDYRGPQGAWKVWTGWRDTLAATLQLQQQHPSVQRTIVWGISMGGEVSGLAIAYGPGGTYDLWVEDVGVENLLEEWATVPGFQGAIQAETGGTPLEAPQAYVERSPALQVQGLAASGLQRAYVIHGAQDTVVTPTQAQELTAALVAAGVPVSAYTDPAAGHVSLGAPILLELLQGRPAWPSPLVEGVATPLGFVPPLVPP